MTRNRASAGPGCSVAGRIPGLSVHRATCPLLLSFPVHRHEVPAVRSSSWVAPRPPPMAVTLRARAPPSQHARRRSSAERGLSVPGGTHATGRQAALCRHFTRPVSPEGSEAPSVVAALAHAAPDKQGPCPHAPVSLAATHATAAPGAGNAPSRRSPGTLRLRLRSAPSHLDSSASFSNVPSLSPWRPVPDHLGRSPQQTPAPAGRRSGPSVLPWSATSSCLRPHCGLSRLQRILSSC